MIGTVEGWRSYANARGVTAPSEALDEQALAAMIRANDYIRLRYTPSLRPGLTLDHKPEGHDLSIGEEAVYVAANLELANPGFFTTTYTPDQRKVLTEADGVKWTPVGEGGAVEDAVPISTHIAQLFQPFTIPAGSSGFALTAGRRT